MRNVLSTVVLALVLFPLAGCQPDSPETPDAATADAGGVDAGVPGYEYVEPTAPVTAALASEVWLTQLNDDLLPFWTSATALGVPEGNFPTYRNVDGSAGANTTRYPRMIGRQIYAYSMGYLLTGDATLLVHAKAGVDWLRSHALDTTRGGWYPQLTATGDPNGTGAKTSQDAAYVTLGLASYWFVARDPAVETDLLAARDLIFDPAQYWDASHNRVKDALDFSMTTEVDVAQAGWELVAQLDQINGFLLLAQPVLSTAERREQFLGDLETLGHTLVDQFWQDGIFWGTASRKGIYRDDHVDFGHTLKSYWMLLQTDKRLAGHPFRSFLLDNVYAWVNLAYDGTGMWANRMTSQTAVDNNSRDWWIYEECDAIAATLDLIDGRYADELESTAANWSKFVDPVYHEVYSSLHQDGTVWGMGKANEWKNGFHSVEHAVVLYLHGKYLEKAPVTLYFAVPESDVASFIAQPYTFQGTETSRGAVGDLTGLGAVTKKVAVTFDRLY